MIDLLQSILMAIFQGVIEWLPISSEGQLSLLFVQFYGLEEIEAVTLALLLHIGTMFSVLWYFRSEFKKMVDLRSEITQITLLATLGTAITAIPIVLLFKTYWDDWTKNLPIPPDILFTALIGAFLIFTGLVLSKQPEQGIREINSITYKEALILGMIQGIAALPGISRSGMTISVLLFIGLTQREAFRTSFIISVPAVLGATVLEFVLSGFTIQNDALIVSSVVFPFWLLIITILLTTFIGIITMNSLMKLKNIPYDKFCIGFGSVTIILAVLLLIIQVVI
ncbi:MAG: undecaprenyl-diphosphate phosphatase [Candidatus Hodarchaeales archaeon]|jgi:undecaprenyl-diphosphatase